jgi:NSS family neurotransmitter:Na+ symporter
MKQENFGSRLGFLLVSAGCAIGIGNVWRFPFITGQNGGAVFMLFYLLFLLLMGIPVLSMELAVGRKSRHALIQAYTHMEKPGQKWHWHGWLAFIGNIMLMMYYTTVSGWMGDYFIKFATGTFTPGMSETAVTGVYNSMLANPLEMTIWMGITVVAGFIICAQGLQNGLERVSKYMMSALLVLIVILAVHSCTLEGAGAGLEFYLAPSIKRASEVGWLNVMSAAMCQAFFTLSLGIGAMEIFGSYMKEGNTLLKEAATITALDTFVAVMSGLIIFPACFSFGIQPDAGPSLIFVTLPNVFLNMAGGRIWGSLFFVFMTFASFSTVIAVFENINKMCREQFGWDRKKASIINCVLIFLLSLPCVLGFNVWSGVSLIKGGGIMDSEDYIVSNLILPIGSLIFTLFCSWKFGWGFENYQKEANNGSGLKVQKWLKPYFRFILPVLVILILAVSAF